jgi:hypothetical protein
MPRSPARGSVRARLVLLLALSTLPLATFAGALAIET